MDFLKKAALDQVMGGKDKKSDKTNTTAQGSSSSGKKEDSLDKGIDLFQEHVLKQGSQKNESAAQQATDDKIKSGIKSLFKMATGKDMK
ncbi:hypothetical protein EST38_g3644 [Candolleomyces aberdarensis]|uniref:Uncharacterized protein n=1 Tax=Candolleomyces aberdarensis TaxID=2316362 RepID=A0A4Q2DPX5_9AGAR|nr:hypothetical protein EST38_g3644 [Candolleomyces aberdarensis]